MNREMTKLGERIPMVQLVEKLLTTEEFISTYGDRDRYELVDGELIDLEPTGLHEQVTAMIARKLNVEIERQNLDFFIPHRCLIKLLGTKTAFRPDAILLDRTQLTKEPLWQREPIITLSETTKLVVEVVSTNWENDYARKVEDYALFSISEYWIVDYLGLGGRDYIGSPKQPTITVCNLQGDRYQKRLFRRDELIISETFPMLQLNTSQIFGAAA
jgi:Uma2 family endonuclease